MPGFIGFPEIMLLCLVALVLFGPKKLPEMGRGLGKGMREFKDSLTGETDHGFDVNKLTVPDGTTQTPTQTIHTPLAVSDETVVVPIVVVESPTAHEKAA
jgi:sec-independent protein translocase protein TatA